VQAGCPEPPQETAQQSKLDLDLFWARESRACDPEGRLSIADSREAHWLISAIVEALDGRRQVGQLNPYLAPKVAQAVQTRANGRELEGLRLRSLHLSQPAKDIIEACSTVEYGTRARALAARLEVVQHKRMRRWACHLLRLL
jgi:hypothetical protein